MILFTLQFLQKTFPHYTGVLNKEITIEQVMTDSRKNQVNALFIPIIGENFNGHDFINAAIANGAVAALWDESEAIPQHAPSSFVFFIVNDTIKALQSLAKEYRNEINPIVIGVTGSNGKTTTKDLLLSVLQTTFRTYATVGNFNNHIGLPLTILQMDRDTEVVVLEMGMNNFGEIDLLTKIAMPDYAIITNIGESHIEHLGSREGIAKAKLEITNGLKKDGLLLIDGDEALIKHVQNEKFVISCGFGKSNDVMLSDIKISNDETAFNLGNDCYYTIPLLGRHHAKNASLAITIAKRLGIKDAAIQTGLSALQHSAMRFELIKGKNGVSIINDAYNASATSMKAAIEVVKQMTGFKRKIIVLGDILELGDYAESLHRSVATVIDTPIDYVYAYGKNAKIISDEVKQTNPSIQSLHFVTKESLIHTLQNDARGGTLILFKASRGMAFEQLIKTLI